MNFVFLSFDVCLAFCCTTFLFFREYTFFYYLQQETKRSMHLRRLHQTMTSTLLFVISTVASRALGVCYIFCKLLTYSNETVRLFSVYPWTPVHCVYICTSLRFILNCLFCVSVVPSRVVRIQQGGMTPHWLWTVVFTC